MNETVKNAFKHFGESVSKHSPEIFTGLSVVGLISSLVMAVKATPKAMKEIEKLKTEKRKNIIRNNPDVDPKNIDKYATLDLKDYVRTCWKFYIPSALMATTSIGCMVTSNCINARRNGVLAAAYGMSQETLREYQKYVVDEIGVKKEQNIRDKMAKEKVSGEYKGTFDPGKTVGEQLFFDGFSGRWFVSTMVKVKTAENNVDRDIINDNYACVNDFYSYLNNKDMPPIKSGSMGWKTGEKMKIDYVAAIRESDGLAYIILNYDIKAPYKEISDFG